MKRILLLLTLLTCALGLVPLSFADPGPTRFVVPELSYRQPDVSRLVTVVDVRTGVLTPIPLSKPIHVVQSADGERKFGFAVAYDLCHKEVIPVATYKIGTLHDVLGRPGFNLDALGLGGADQDGTINLGMALVQELTIAREVKGQVGPWARYDGTTVRIGVFFGIGGSFGS